MLEFGQYTILVEEWVRTKVMKSEGSSPLFGTAWKSSFICDREGAKHVVDGNSPTYLIQERCSPRMEILARRFLRAEYFLHHL